MLPDNRPVHRHYEVASSLGAVALVVTGAVGGIVGADLVPSSHAFEAMVIVGGMSILVLIKVVKIISKELLPNEEDLAWYDLRGTNLNDGLPRPRPTETAANDASTRGREAVSRANDFSTMYRPKAEYHDDQVLQRHESFPLTDTTHSSDITDSGSSKGSKADRPCTRQESRSSRQESRSSTEDDLRDETDRSFSSLADTIESEQEVHLRARVEYEKQRLSQMETPSRVKATAHYLRFYDEDERVVRYAVRNSKKRSCSILEYLAKDEKPQRIRYFQCDPESSIVWDGHQSIYVPHEDFSMVVKGLSLLCKIASIPLERSELTEQPGISARRSSLSVLTSSTPSSTPTLNDSGSTFTVCESKLNGAQTAHSRSGGTDEIISVSSNE